MPCEICGRVQEDPTKGMPSPWARAVLAGKQVLICPECQRGHPDWSRTAERCPRCGGLRVSLQLGFRVCRQCGHDWEVP